MKHLKMTVPSQAGTGGGSFRTSKPEQKAESRTREEMIKVLKSQDYPSFSSKAKRKRTIGL